MTGPSRVGTFSSIASAPVASDESSTTSTVELLIDRLRAWKHVVADLESYTQALIKLYTSRAKDSESELVSILAKPLREGRQFLPGTAGVDGNDASKVSAGAAGIVALFDSLRENTRQVVAEQTQAAAVLKTSVLQALERLHQEVKVKSKEIDDGVGKSIKTIEKARKDAQRQIENLGRLTATFETNGPGSCCADEDPVLVRRAIRHQVGLLVADQNNHRRDLLGVQAQLASFEAYLVKTVRGAVEELSTAAANEATACAAHYRNISVIAADLHPEREWKAFVGREGETGTGTLLPEDVTESACPEEQSTFANMNHASTVPFIAGTVERQVSSKRTMGLGKKFTPLYAMITPAGYIHLFPAEEIVAAAVGSGTTTGITQTASPELSLFLPECTVGAEAPAAGQLTISGKSAATTTKRIAGVKLGGFVTHDLLLRAPSPAEGAKWLAIARAVSKGEPVPGSEAAVAAAAAAAKPAAAAAAPVTAAPPAYSPKLDQNKEVKGSPSAVAEPGAVAAPAAATTTAAAAAAAPAAETATTTAAPQPGALPEVGSLTLAAKPEAAPSTAVPTATAAPPTTAAPTTTAAPAAATKTAEAA